VTLCPRCPLCDSLPSIVLDPTQAICPADGCPVFMWDSTRSLDENLMDAHSVNFSTENGEE